jgi:hypothetical protein
MYSEIEYGKKWKNCSRGDFVPRQMFIDACKSGAFIDYDGHGYPVNKEEFVTDIQICPSMLYSTRGPDLSDDKINKLLPENTIIGVQWFNR